MSDNINKMVAELKEIKDQIKKYAEENPLESSEANQCSLFGQTSNQLYVLLDQIKTYSGHIVTYFKPELNKSKEYEHIIPFFQIIEEQISNHNKVVLCTYNTRTKTFSLQKGLNRKDTVEFKNLEELFATIKIFLLERYASATHIIMQAME